MTQTKMPRTILTLLFLVITARLDEAQKSQGCENVATSQEGLFDNPERLKILLKVFEKHIEMEKLNITLHFLENPIRPNVQISEAARVIAYYLEESCEENNWVHGKKVLELGAGLGFPGIVAACLGGNVTVTDRPQIVPYLQRSIDLNIETIQKISGEIRVEVLSWGDDEKIRSMPKQDIILLSEAIYDDLTIDDLISTMVRLSHDDTKIIVSEGDWIEMEESELKEAWTKFFHDSSEYFEFSPLPIGNYDCFTFEGKVRKTSNTEEKTSESSPGHTEF
nr:PREDICTED: protein N-lysine methyltransferase METTL21A-like [Bemisia tabaci]